MSFTRALPALFLLVAVGCSTEPTSQLFTPDVRVTYRYTATTAFGLPLLEGTVRFDSATDGEVPEMPLPLPIRGTWSIDWAPGADHSSQVGPVIGTGEFDGTTGPGQIRMSLTPRLVDANVDLEGTSNGDGVTGAWHYSSLMGPTTFGHFTLTPIR